MEIKLTTPLTKEKIKNLKAGDRVLLSGEIYTARDAAHERLCETIKNGDTLPVDLTDMCIYYAGPCPAKPGQVIGSCGPTTSGRCDKYTPALLELGVGAMIGKGERNKDVIDSIVKNGCVYFAAIGGCGALIAKSVTKSSVVAYEDLGTEAIRKLTVCDFPLTVVIDKDGNNLYQR